MRSAVIRSKQKNDMPIRCRWAGNDPLYIRYHDTEWGVPLHDDAKLFEFLVLEGAQAGLSWLTVLKKRENYRSAFDNFDVKKISAYDSFKVQKLLSDSGIVRNRLKIEATVQNARAFQNVQTKFGSVDRYIWRFVGGRPIRNRWKAESQIPTQTPESTAMSKDLKQHGFRFVGPTICYAFMQAVGMVNDHVVRCFRYEQV